MNVDALSKKEQKQLWTLLNDLRALCLNGKHEPALAMVGLCQMMGYLLAMGDMDMDMDKDLMYSLVVDDIDLAYDIAVSLRASAEALDKMKGGSTGVKGDSDD